MRQCRHVSETAPASPVPARTRSQLVPRGVLLKTPKRLQALHHEGLIDSVVRQLMSGKEATVYIVRCGEELRCAKVYKDANKRSFRQAALYQEGRRTKNSREARAMAKGSRFGREKQEEAWQNVEVDTLYPVSYTHLTLPTKRI